MSGSPVFLAVDLGASSGRVLAAEFDGEKLTLNEVSRFPSVSVLLNKGRHWDILGLYANILSGIRKAGAQYGDRIQSIGVDTWGVDYALIDSNGALLGNPYQYRDTRTDGMMEKAFQRISREAIFEETGIQFMQFNTVFQLYAEVLAKSPALEVAAQVLFLPDLINFWLTGVIAQERTIASTSQILNPNTGTWSAPILSKLEIPARLFGEITESGTTLGPLRKGVIAETRTAPFPVIAIGGHDTASAVTGTPLSRDSKAFLSSGTWSLMGMENDQPVINAEALDAGFSNEAGVFGTTRFLKNICGLWLIEECRREWASNGCELSYDKIVQLAEQAAPFTAIIDPDDPRFAVSGDMPGKISSYCAESRQRVPETRGEVLRIAFESLAAKYRVILDRLEYCSHASVQTLQVVGGGCQNAFLNQCTADALERPVIAGPAEATSLGNLLMQMIGTEAINDLEEGRRIISQSFQAELFEPGDQTGWQEAVAGLTNRHL